MSRNFIPFIVSICFICSCSPDEETFGPDLESELISLVQSRSGSGSLSFYSLPSSDDFNQIPQDPENPLNESKVTLGKLLFHETAFAKANLFQETENTYSCASCHHAGAGFQSGNVQGIGEGGVGFGLNGESRLPDDLYVRSKIDVQPVRSPSILNLAFQTNLLWNGQFGSSGLNSGTEAYWNEDTPVESNFLGFEGLETQAIAGIKVHRMLFDEALIEEYGYRELFDQSFPELATEDRYTNITAGLAIAAYERTVMANNAPFQLWLRGNKMALSDYEKEGAILFFGKAGCYSCHNGPSLANMEFAAIGLNDLAEEEAFFLPPVNNSVLGRGSFTGAEEDMYRFKVPQLYNLKDNPFYGHGSSFRSLRDILEYKNKALSENDQVPLDRLDSRFVPLRLTEMELDALVNFIEESLYDSALDRYVPEVTLSGLCFPNNDILSSIDLNCY